MLTESLVEFAAGEYPYFLINEDKLYVIKWGKIITKEQ